MADQEPRTGPPTREASEMRGMSEPRDREPRSREPRKSGNSGKRSVPFGLKPGLFAGIIGKFKFWISFFAGVLGLFVIIGVLFSFTIDAGIFTTEGTGAWVVVLSWIGSVWLFGQWLKARYGRQNKIFREQ